MNINTNAQVCAHIVQKLNIAYALVDENLVIQTGNPTLQQWIPPPCNTLVGQPLTKIFPDLAGLENILRRLDKAFTLSRVHHSNAGGPERYFDLRFEPAPELDQSFLLTITDVTEQGHLEQEFVQQRNELHLTIAERKRVEQTLRNAYDEVEMRVLARTAELTKANNALQTEIVERKQVETSLRKIRNTLETRVQERTTALQTEVVERKRAEAALKESLEQIERAKQEWEATADSLSQLVCLVDSKGGIIRANRTVERWQLGRVVDIKGQQMHTLFHPNWADFWPRAWADVARGKSVQHELEDETLKRHLYIQVHPTLNQSNRQKQAATSFATVVISDITERKHAEEELRRAKNAAEAANRAKSVFLASMSHELRTPLSVIIGYSELLQEEFIDAGQSDLLPDIASINQSGNHLLTLIDNIISLSKIEAGEMKLYPDIFEVRVVIDTLVAQARPLIEMNNNRLDVRQTSNLGSMHSDQVLIRQILFNLLSNANKFTRQGVVTFNVSCQADSPNNDEENQEWLIFTVTDTGIGMTEEELQRIFDAFVQGDTLAMRRYGDAGLSLAISRRLCQMMGGDITVESAVNQGSTFTVKLPRKITELAGAFEPLNKTAEPNHKPAIPLEEIALPSPLPPEPDLERPGDQIIEPPAPRPLTVSADTQRSALTSLTKSTALQPQSEQPPTILVVDDNRDIRRMVSMKLKREGYVFVTAENGRQGLELAQSQPFDLIITDIMMPEMNGYQLLEQLKADPALQHIPVIVISAVDNLNSVIKCIEMGAEDYLFKPFNTVLLKARVAASLEKKQLRDHERTYLQQIQIEQEKSEQLLLNILPKPVAHRLKQGQEAIADNYPSVTILFADIVGFTELSARTSPIELVGMLNEIFSAFDRLAEKHGLEKIKTIGDSYMVVGGLPTPQPNHAQAIANMALDMQAVIAQLGQEYYEALDTRIGINTGPVIAGVIGTKKFIYDLWGDAVNTASRMESHGVIGQIQVSAATYALLQDEYLFKPRGVVNIKGKGEMTTYLLTGKK